MFALGFIAGLLSAVLVVATLTYFRRIVEKRIEVIQAAVDNKAPRPRGFLIEGDEAEEARQEIVERNRRRGRDTRLEELQ